jgi:ArsR family transcriptional regulator, arsenate/arsenite/antimonite-responsive transcriptional repressor
LNRPVNEAAEIFKALGDSTRLKILKILSIKGSVLCVGKIACILDISQPAVSQHLKVLKNAGLVEADRQGFHMHYRIKNDTLKLYGIKTEDLLKPLSYDIEIRENCGETKGNCVKKNE